MQFQSNIDWGVNSNHSPTNSLADIVNNLHGAITKTVAQKALNILAEKGEVTHKPYGKQSVYVINQVLHNVVNVVTGWSVLEESLILFYCYITSQNQFELPSSDDLASMDMKINTLKTEIMEYTEKNKQLQLGAYINLIFLGTCVI